jgi:3-oxoacyl-(acyl-carrier-protein) synthase
LTPTPDVDTSCWGQEAAIKAIRLVISGSGAVSPGPAETLSSSNLNASGLSGHVIEDFQLSDYVKTVASYIDRCSALGLAAVAEAVDSARISKANGDEKPWGLYYATAWGCLDSMERFFEKVKKNPKFAPPLVFSHAYANSPTSIICIEFGLGGPGTTLCEGNTGALTAIGLAHDRMISNAGQETPGVLVAASDALSAGARATADSRGLIPGEAAGAVTLELEPAALKRGLAPLAIILGWGSASRQKAPERALQAALSNAGIEMSQIGRLHFCGPDPKISLPESCQLIDLNACYGSCGPAATLLVLDSICMETSPGVDLILACDYSGQSSALLVERTPNA